MPPPEADRRAPPQVSSSDDGRIISDIPQVQGGSGSAIHNIDLDNGYYTVGYVMTFYEAGTTTPLTVDATRISFFDFDHGTYAACDEGTFVLGSATPSPCTVCGGSDTLSSSGGTYDIDQCVYYQDGRHADVGGRWGQECLKVTHGAGTSVTHMSYVTRAGDTNTVPQGHSLNVASTANEVEFCARELGNGDDTPNDAMSLTDSMSIRQPAWTANGGWFGYWDINNINQKARSVIINYVMTSQVKFDFSVGTIKAGTQIKSGRNILISGNANIIDSCSPSPPPPA